MIRPTSRQSAISLTVALSALLGLAPAAHAGDEAPSTDRQKPSAQKAAGGANQPNDPRSKAKTGGQNPSQTGDDPLSEAIEQMRQVEQRIAEKNTGKETQQKQTQIVKYLQTLIEQAEQQEGRGKSQSQQQRPSDQPQQQTKQAERPLKNQKRSKGQQAQVGQGEGQPNSQAKQSTERDGRGKSVTPQRDRDRRMVEQVWGHLPEKLRQQMRNVYSEDYLPKYETLIRRYFEALAEQDQGQDQP